MFLLDQKVCWSASDLTQASSCEFALLRVLDDKLGRAKLASTAEDALLDHIAAKGDEHEAKVLEQFQESHRQVLTLERAKAYSSASLHEVQATTLQAMASGADVVCQAGFFDGEFHGYADFLVRSDEGWVVCDAKLARSARPRALLQLAAYADQLRAAGQPVAPRAVLLLGDGRPEEFPLAEIEPVFRERRQRLRDLIADHRDSQTPVSWGDDEVVACGACAECAAAAESAEDVILVAGLRMDQRRKLRAAGIETLSGLAAASEAPSGMAENTFENLRRQAILQKQQRDDPEGKVRHELRPGARKGFQTLPPPSPGDIFFDFEGDPLHNEGDPGRWGLEYLWGVMTTPGPGEAQGKFLPLWAHSHKEEREALAAFLDDIVERRQRDPGMHIYHYAPYETTALKRLVAIHQTHEDVLDDLLRGEVFVDLYATVRATVRVSQPSYSIKKLEPLYMGDDLREGEVTAGDQSIAEYHAYHEDMDRGEIDSAQVRLDELADYNRYDCLSTLRLREWLLALKDAPTTTEPDGPDEPTADETGGTFADDLQLVADLLARATDLPRGERGPDQQAYAMLAAALGYFRREDKPFWWEHFDRLKRPLEEWAEDRDVFRISGHEVVQEWGMTGKQKKPRRTLRLTGQWAPGSTPGTQACVVYPEPHPVAALVPKKALLGYVPGQEISSQANASVVLVESCSVGEEHQNVPVALSPAAPPNAKVLVDSLRSLCMTVLHDEAMPAASGMDLLRRLPPRLSSGEQLPNTGDAARDIATALRTMDSSYIAVQGPPGTGKTWTGSRVVRTLVEDHGWRIGIVAQSHAVVEHMLDAILEAQLDASLIGKSAPRRADPAWTEVPNSGDDRRAWLEEHSDSGCVLGGTAWTFSSDKILEAGGLDLLVIDEAGQFALAPTLAVSRVADRLLLLGDPQQLPQVSQGTHPEPVDRSALGWLLGDHDTMPMSHGYFLGTSYRMHPDLCREVSQLSYESRLGSAPAAADRSLEGLSPGLSVVEIDHHDNRTESPEEADAVVDLVRSVIGRAWWDPSASEDARPLGPGDILVVAPYNAQVNLIRRTLADVGLEGVRVGTVDKFQGQQAPVAILSMTASSHGDVPRGMGFLLSRNRINVAVSRAQWHAYIVRSTALTSYMPSTVDDLLQLGAFAGLCNPPAAQAEALHAR